MVDENQKNWDVKIETVLMGYRASRQASTKYSPYFLHIKHICVLTQAMITTISRHYRVAYDVAAEHYMNKTLPS